MSLKSEIKKINSLEEAEKLIGKEIKSLTTLWSKVYPDFEGKWSEQIKAYSSNEGGYVVVVKTIEEMQVKELDIFFTKNEPTTPHPVFPVPHSYMTNFIKFSFERDGESNE